MSRKIIMYGILCLSNVLFSSCFKSSGSNTDSSNLSTQSSTIPAVGIETLNETIIMTASSSASSSTTAATHSDPVYYTPFPFSTIIQDAYTPTLLTDASTLENRTRYLFKSSSGKYLAIGNSGSVSADSTLLTYKDTLSKIFEIVFDSNHSGWFRLDSELHAVYSLDSDSSGNLTFQNNWGTAATPTSRGYVVFSYDSSTKLLQAQARYSYDLSTYTHSTTPDSSFSCAGYYFQEYNGSFKLVSSAASATPMSIYNSPSSVSVPTDFNPDSISYQPNGPVLIESYVGNSISDMEGAGSKTLQYLSSAYLPQVVNAGNDSGTSSAAATMLNTIETALSAEGASLRYPKALYLAFRTGLLSQTLQSDSIANGILGMQLVPYVYFTNEADSSGTHHPFMVIASYSLADKPNRLLDVNRPPGDGTTSSYVTQKVTRNATLQLYLIKIPLKNYGEISSLTDNTMLETLNSAQGNAVANNVYNYASTSAVGVASDGVVIYPSSNNTLAFAQNDAEVTSTGIHVGQGMGLHYHADGHSALSNDLSLYNIHDYAGQSHPPLIGFSFDGIALFGIYETSYSSMEGYNVALDEYGGHSHGTLGYHYHAHRVQKTSSTNHSFTLHVLLKGAWKGKINSIPDFWDTTLNEPAYSLSQRHAYVGKP